METDSSEINALFGEGAVGLLISEGKSGWYVHHELL